MTIHLDIIALWTLPVAFSAFPAEHGRSHPLRRPVEEIVTAGPAMHLRIADDAGETAGVLGLRFLPGRGVVHPATGAGEILCRPNAIGHGAIICGPGGSRNARAR